MTVDELLQLYRDHNRKAKLSRAMAEQYLVDARNACDHAAGVAFGYSIGYAWREAFICPTCGFEINATEAHEKGIDFYDLRSGKERVSYTQAIALREVFEKGET